MRPIVLPAYIGVLQGLDKATLSKQVQQHYSRLYNGNPLVTIVIPAYNEAENILTTLCSITQNTTLKSVEVIVVNNNSTDDTAALVSATGVPCITELTPGVKHARNAGLMAAKGKYIINADADSIYPPTWIDTMIDPLEADNGIALSYGKFAFLPTGNTPRFVYCMYESVADILRLYKKWFKEEGMNVYGCNSAFRKEHCLQVDGYEHPPGANEDGWLAVKLRNKGFGRLHHVSSSKAIVWTVDRHLQNDGGLLKAFLMRVKNAGK